MSREYLAQEQLKDALIKMRVLWQTPCSTPEFNDGVRALVAASDEAVETIKRLRKIAAYVPSRVYIEAKEKAGFAEQIVTTASAQETKPALTFDPATWPRDPKAPQRFLCSPDHPMPKGSTGQWSHTNPRDNGECSDGCCDDYKCADCGHTWRVECAD